MDSDHLKPLFEALKLTPENNVLRAHLVRELVKARRYEEITSVVSPLLTTSERPLGLFASARAAWVKGDKARAEQLYRQAIAIDPSLIDESFEADLAPKETLRLSNVGRLEGELPDDLIGERKVPEVTFEDLGGMEEVKEQVRLQILYPMQRPDIYEAYGKKVGGGILLYGPPGCGKTHLARATAGELGANFFSVALNEILDMYVGNSEKNLAKIFQTARAAAPSVLFIDEVDAIGGKRGRIDSSSHRLMVTQLLTEMDGIGARNEKLLVLGATNEPWSVDTALRRPGRFDRLLFVPPPDTKARAEILKLHTRRRKMDGSIDWQSLAKKTELFSGADLAQLVEQATESALSEALKTGNLRSITGVDFEQALKKRKPSTTEWLRRSKNYVNFANQDGFYDDLANFLKKANIR